MPTIDKLSPPTYTPNFKTNLKGTARQDMLNSVDDMDFGNENYDEYKKGTVQRIDGFTYFRDPKTKKLMVKNSKGEIYRPNKESYDDINETYFNGKLGRYSGADKTTKPSYTPSTKTVPVERLAPPSLPNKNLSTLEEMPPDYNTKRKSLSPETKYNLSVLKDVGLDVAGATAQYANSKKALSALSKVKIPDAPQQSYVNASRVNMDVDRGMNENALGTGINALKRGFSDANTAAAVRGSLLSNYTQQGSKINQEERNQNIQAQNQANIYNSEIQGKNATAQYLKNTAEMSKQIDLIKGKQLANQELIGGLTGAVTNERKRAAEDNTTLLGLSTKDPEFMKYYGSVARGRSGYAANSNSLTDEQAQRVSDAVKTMQIPTNKDGKSKYGGVLNKMRNGGKLNKMC